MTEVIESMNQNYKPARMSTRQRSITVSEYLQELLPTRILRIMLAKRGIFTAVVKALDGNQNRHLVNVGNDVQLSEGRFVYSGEAFCGRYSRAFTKTGARKKGVTCEGCVHISRALLARTILKTR